MNYNAKSKLKQKVTFVTSYDLEYVKVSLK